VLHATAGDTFQPGGSYPIGGTATDVAVADLNGDGRLDLAVTASSSRSVGVLLARDDGTYDPAVSYPTTPIDSIFSGPTALAVGDLDADGRLDLVTANYDSDIVPSTVSVLLGSSDGTFAPRLDFSTANGPCDVAIGDLTGDGTMDLAVANRYSNVASVLPGRGDGTFKPKVDYHADGASAVAIGDLDHDGRRDLVVAGGDLLSVLLGRPDGTLADAVEYDLSNSTRAVAIADLDIDGHPDLVATVSLSPTVASSTTDPSGVIGVLLGNGDGTFAPPAEYVAGSTPNDAAIGDLDDDGRPDIVVTNGATETATVLYNSCQ
jgi:hypothetical protein